MLNLVWAGLLVAGVAVAVARGNADVITETAMTAADSAIQILIGLLGVMVLWLGLSRIAEDAGLVRSLARLVQPVLRRLFPTIPRDHPAMGAITMNISANMLGLGSAATPFGLKAMQHLQELNPDKETASDPMITFLVLNTSGVTLVPAVIIGLRAQHGSANPAEIMVPVFLATLCSTAVGLGLDRLIRRRDRGR